MIDVVPPALVFIVGALVVPLIKGKWKSAFLLLLPVIGFINLINIPEGSNFVVSAFGLKFIFGRVDRLSLLFGYIYHIIAFVALLYSLHVKDDLQHFAGLIYSGSALGVIFAGDLLSLFIFWEMLTVGSAILIWSRRTTAATLAGYRYVLVHAVGGLCLLTGIVLYLKETGSLQFGYIGLNSTASLLILLGFGVNAAWPVLHAWLPDAYPESTPTGTVFLSVYTTKTAVYTLARGFAGTEILIWIGAIMTVFPVFFAVIENNLRRVLSYSLINQVGYMVCGVGIGTQLAINGAVSHVFAHCLYKALLFMSMGAVLHRTGKINCTALGGLYRTMPITAVCCIVAAASISGFPFLSGFVTKSMTIQAAVENHLVIIWFLLMVASIGVLEHAGIKVPYFAFFGHDSGLRPKEAPLNMCFAMCISAFLCIAIGLFPNFLYKLLPYPVVDFVPYSASHVVGMAQLLLFSALAFVLLLAAGVYPPERRGINVDADWFYRKGGRLFYFVMDKCFNGINRISEMIFVGGLAGFLGRISRDGHIRAALLFLVPVLTAGGATGEKLTLKKASVRAALQTGTSPVGISAAIATVFLIVVYVLL
jgi:multicomponent Na+:H+ antiporter subunit D